VVTAASRPRGPGPRHVICRPCVLSKCITRLHSKLLDTCLLIDAADKLKFARRSAQCPAYSLPVSELCDGFLSFRARWPRNPSPKRRNLARSTLRKYPRKNPAGHRHQPVVSTCGGVTDICRRRVRCCAGAKFRPRQQGSEPCAASAPAGDLNCGTCVPDPGCCPVKSIGVTTILPAKNRPEGGSAARIRLRLCRSGGGQPLQSWWGFERDYAISANIFSYGSKRDNGRSGDHNAVVCGLPPHRIQGTGEMASC
jgi:hypothetical protein